MTGLLEGQAGLYLAQRFLKAVPELEGGIPFGKGHDTLVAGRTGGKRVALQVYLVVGQFLHPCILKAVLSLINGT